MDTNPYRLAMTRKKLDARHEITTKALTIAGITLAALALGNLAKSPAPMAQSPIEKTPNPEDARLTLIHNEEAKARASYYNSCASGFFTTGSVGPFIAFLVWYLQTQNVTNPDQALFDKALILVAILAAFAVILVPIGYAFHRKALRALRSLRV